MIEPQELSEVVAVVFEELATLMMLVRALVLFHRTHRSALPHGFRQVLLDPLGMSRR